MLFGAPGPFSLCVKNFGSSSVSGVEYRIGRGFSLSEQVRWQY